MDLPAALCALHREVAVLYGSTARGLDLTPQQAELLHQLDDGSASFGELARRLGCDKSNMTGMVDRLARRGLLRRETDPTDRRVSKPVLTKEGAALVTDLRARFAATVAERCAEMSAADRTDLVRLANNAADALTTVRTVRP